MIMWFLDFVWRLFKFKMTWDSHLCKNPGLKGWETRFRRDFGQFGLIFCSFLRVDLPDCSSLLFSLFSSIFLLLILFDLIQIGPKIFDKCVMGYKFLGPRLVISLGLHLGCGAKSPTFYGWKWTCQSIFSLDFFIGPREFRPRK